MQTNLYCKICRKKRLQDETILSEIAHSENQTIMDWFKAFRQGDDSFFKEAAMEYTRQRMEEESDKYGGELSDSDAYENFRAKVLPRDIERCFEKYLKQKDIVLSQGEIKITHKGARKVANLVKLKLENLSREKSGAHKIKKSGHGLNIALYSRKYEFGDTLANIDLERTLLSSLERNIQNSGRLFLSLKPEDFYIHEKTFEARMCIGLLIDESASMGGIKRSAAIDICLALGKLKKPGDVLKVFLYAAEVKEIQYWEILNTSLGGGTTDMKTALQSARKALKKEKGDKQIYIITDAEPNTENGKYVGFKKAVSGVKQEAMHCRRENITINMVMLDNNSKLKIFAGHIARINAGRVFFTSPSNAGEVVVQDYMAACTK